MTLTFEERLNRLGITLKNKKKIIFFISLADTDLNIERIKSIEKAFGSDNKVFHLKSYFFKTKYLYFLRNL